jgi:hypothetical protein
MSTETTQQGEDSKRILFPIAERLDRITTVLEHILAQLQRQERVERELFDKTLIAVSPSLVDYQAQA